MKHRSQILLSAYWAPFFTLLQPQQSIAEAHSLLLLALILGDPLELVTVVGGVEVRVASDSEKTLASSDSDGAGGVGGLRDRLVVLVKESSALELGHEQVDDLWWSRELSSVFSRGSVTFSLLSFPIGRTCEGRDGGAPK